MSKYTYKQFIPNRRNFFLSILPYLALSKISKAKENSLIASDLPWDQGGQIKVTGGTIHWSSMGSGEPLILMPKLGGWIADWRHIAPMLARNYKVIAIDNPGHGKSLIYDEPPYLISLTQSASMLMSALDTLNIKTFNAVGNSLGGCILTIAASLWPEHFRKLALISVKFYRSMTLIELKEKDIALIGKSFNKNGLPINRSFKQISKRFGISDPQIIEEQNSSRKLAGKWLAPSERGVGRAGIDKYIKNIKAPTLLIYGEKENSGYKDFEEIARKNFDTIKSIHIKNSGAFPHQEDPKETSRILIDFFNS